MSAPVTLCLLAAACASASASFTLRRSARESSRDPIGRLCMGWMLGGMGWGLLLSALIVHLGSAA